MTSTAWEAAALERIIAVWAAMIAKVFGFIVGLIVATAGNVRNSLYELGAYSLARELSPEFVMVDLGGRSEDRIKAQFAKPSAYALLRRLPLNISLADAGKRPRAAKGIKPM